jgi:hypothetical protein
MLPYMSLDYNKVHYTLLLLAMENFMDTSMYKDEICKERIYISITSKNVPFPAFSGKHKKNVFYLLFISN